jgi:cell division septal protein FtsQ
MYMRGNNHQTDMVPENISALRAEVAELKTEVKHLNQQSASRDRLLHGIATVVIGAMLVWFWQNAINSYSTKKATTVSISTSTAR